MSFDLPWLLWLLPLALLPLLPAFGQNARPLVNTWAALLPRDRASQWIDAALRGAAVLALAGTLIGIAGPSRPEYGVERVGRGAEIVLLLDRSRSMDQRFGGAPPAGGAPKGTGPEALDYYNRLRDSADREPKGKVARRLLADFTARRPQDRFALIAFSGIPLPVLDFSQKPPAIRAAIDAGNIGRGLSETDIGLALQSAFRLFEGRPYTGSRIVMLVSDGGDHIDPDMRAELSIEARKLRLSLYWIYIRSMSSPNLPTASAASADADADGGSAMPRDADTSGLEDAVPEHALHRYFEAMGVPYRAYEADNPAALRDAIAQVDRLENLPITYTDIVPRRDLSGWAYAAALAGTLLLLAAARLRIRRWD